MVEEMGEKEKRKKGEEREQEKKMRGNSFHKA